LIRNRLKEVLAEKNISQARLSRLADVSITTIQLLYHDPYHETFISTLDKLSKALKVPITDLFEVLPDEKKEE
jgi:DNA-binding Xre family transcriptional regulator